MSDALAGKPKHDKAAARLQRTMDRAQALALAVQFTSSRPHSGEATVEIAAAFYDFLCGRRPKKSSDTAET